MGGHGIHRVGAGHPGEGGAGCLKVLGGDAVGDDTEAVSYTHLDVYKRQALGVDAVLVTPRCADPLYRRAVRVSMGTVFQVPWTRIEPWPLGGPELLRENGFTVAAFALTETAMTLDELSADPPERLALVLGTEGDGLTRHTLSLIHI